MGSERKSRPQWFFCYRAEDETQGGVDLRSSRTGVDTSSGNLLLWEERSFGLAGEVGVWAKQQVGEGRLEGGRSVCLTGDGMLPRVFCFRAGYKTGGWGVESKEKVCR